MASVSAHIFSPRDSIFTIICFTHSKAAINHHLFSVDFYIGLHLFLVGVHFFSPDIHSGR
jgi:hypothetical protein